MRPGARVFESQMVPSRSWTASQAIMRMSRPAAMPSNLCYIRYLGTFFADTFEIASGKLCELNLDLKHKL